MNPLTALPAKVRRSIYAFYATLGVSFGAVQVGFATADVSQPTWLLVAFGVFGYLGTALGLVAAANTIDVQSFSKAVTDNAVAAERLGRDAGRTIYASDPNSAD